jgi:hypothetical protein
MKEFDDFNSDESGAVTVDWVVLTAAIIGMGMLVLAPVAYSTDSTAQAVGGHISGVSVGYQGN